MDEKQNIVQIIYQVSPKAQNEELRRVPFESISKLVNLKTKLIDCYFRHLFSEIL